MRFGALAAAAATALALTACGDDTFSASDLVSQLNDHGAGLELGEELQSEREGVDVYALSFADGSGGGGSLTVTEDADAGLAEFQRCQAAGALICFRADNAVLIFEDALDPAARANLEAALTALAGD